MNFLTHLRILLTATIVFFSLLPILASVLGLWLVESVQARLLLIWLLAFCLLLIVSVWISRQRYVLSVLFILASIAIGSWGFLALAYQPIDGMSSSAVTLLWDWRRPPVESFLARVPEIDFIRAGWAAGGVFAVTAPQRVFLIDYSERLYERMERDEELAGLPSDFPSSPLDLLWISVPPRAYWVHGSDTWAPPIVFLHGSGGNFRAYILWCRELARRTGRDVLLVSDGFGFWRAPEGMNRIDIMLDELARLRGEEIATIDLVWVSNGGRGMTRYVAAGRRTVDRLVAISPVLEPPIIEHPRFMQRAPKTHWLIIHGDADDRIPMSYILHSEQLLSSRTANVSTDYRAGADHFLLFREWESVLETSAQALDSKSSMVVSTSW